MKNGKKYDLSDFFQNGYSKKCLKRAEKWGTMDTSGRKWSEVEQSGMESGRPL